jgi:hypothetical protein
MDNQIIKDLIEKQQVITNKIDDILLSDLLSLGDLNKTLAMQDKSISLMERIAKLEKLSLPDNDKKILIFHELMQEINVFLQSQNDDYFVPTTLFGDISQHMIDNYFK